MTKNLPSDVITVKSPCRVVRDIIGIVKMWLDEYVCLSELFVISLLFTNHRVFGLKEVYDKGAVLT